MFITIHDLQQFNSISHLAMPRYLFDMCFDGYYVAEGILYQVSRAQLLEGDSDIVLFRYHEYFAMIDHRLIVLLFEVYSMEYCVNAKNSSPSFSFIRFASASHVS